MDRGLQGGGHWTLGRVLVTGVYTLGDAIAGVITSHALPRPTAPLKLAALPGPAPSLHHSSAPQALQLATVTLRSSEHHLCDVSSVNDDGTDLTVILGQDVKLVPVNVQDSCGEVRVGSELTLELIQSPAIKQVTAASLVIMVITGDWRHLSNPSYLCRIHPLIKHGGVTQRVGAAVVQTPGQAEHLGAVNGL